MAYFEPPKPESGFAICRHSPGQLQVDKLVWGGLASLGGTNRSKETGGFIGLLAAAQRVGYYKYT